MGIAPAEIIGEIPLKRIIFKKRLDIPVLAVADDKKPVVFRKCGKSLLQLRIKLAAVCGKIVFLVFPAFFKYVYTPGLGKLGEKLCRYFHHGHTHYAAQVAACYCLVSEQGIAAGSYCLRP